jgi:hypothetical protein
MNERMEYNIVKDQRGVLHTMLDSMKRGDEVVYHIGEYAAGKHKADALELYNQGKCILYQRKLGDGKFAYIARKPLKP